MRDRKSKSLRQIEILNDPQIIERFKDAYDRVERAEELQESVNQVKNQDYV
jgi:hypothetical protein